eukprot:s2101_g6.t1
MFEGSQKNVAPTLTTTNKYLFVASLDLDKEHSKRKFFRFLHPSERMLLQGFPADVLDDASDALRVHGSGNCIPSSSDDGCLSTNFDRDQACIDEYLGLLTSGDL